MSQLLVPAIRRNYLTTSNPTATGKGNFTRLFRDRQRRMGRRLHLRGHVARVGNILRRLRTCATIRGRYFSTRRTLQVLGDHLQACCNHVYRSRGTQRSRRRSLGRRRTTLSTHRTRGRHLLTTYSIIRTQRTYSSTHSTDSETRRNCHRTRKTHGTGVQRSRGLALDHCGQSRSHGSTLLTR